MILGEGKSYWVKIMIPVKIFTDIFIFQFGFSQFYINFGHAILNNWDILFQTSIHCF